MSADRPYKVGYGRPPLESRFPKGVSGNPVGRKPGSRNVSTVIAAALAEKVVTANGRRRKISKLEAAFIQLANKAAAGDARATKLLVELLHQSQAKEANETPSATPTPQQRQAADEAVLAALREQLAHLDKDPADG